MILIFFQSESEDSSPKTNGIDKLPKPEVPQPAPRRTISQSSTDSKHSVPNNINAMPNNINSKPPPNNNAKKNASTSSLEGDDTQVLPKPITNEEFQAMIPAHFLNKQPPNSEPTHAVTVTIKKPDPIELPPAPKGPGRVTETITKSTFTETTVTRITDNKLVVPVIVEVWRHCIFAVHG